LWRCVAIGVSSLHQIALARLRMMVFMLSTPSQFHAKTIQS